MRATTLYRLKRIGNRYMPGQAGEDVDVILGSIDQDGKPAFLFDYRSHVLIKACAVIRMNRLLTILCSENHVVK